MRLSKRTVTKSKLNVGRHCNIVLFLLCAIAINCCSARGPHHPRSSVKKRMQEQKHINEHLAMDREHIKEDLNAHQLPTTQNVDELTEEEKNYLYFKVHDLDGNDKLDGLEIYYSATHHSVSQNDEHHHEEHHTEEEEEETSNDGQNVQINGSTAEHESSHLELLEKDENGQIINRNFNHIIDVLDNFLNLADLNNDGYLNYAEYAAAVKLGDAIVESERSQEL